MSQLSSAAPARGLRIFRRLLAAAAAGLVAWTAAAAPAHVIIRVPAGRPQPPELAPLLAKWRQAGQVVDVLLLTHGRVENPTPGRIAQFETFAALEFASESAADVWQREAAPALPAGLIVRRADVLAQGELTPRDSSRAVFIVNAYTPIVPPPRFREFVAGYVQPLYEAMRETQHLVRYTAYLERGETGQANALNVLEYRDPAAFAALTAMKSGIREKVAAAVPTYAAFDSIKDTLREDAFGTRATYSELPSPDPKEQRKQRE